MTVFLYTILFLTVESPKMEDPIQNLLSTTGWSCDDLLKKLQQYKNGSKTEVDSPVLSRKSDFPQKKVIVKKLVKYVYRDKYSTVRKKRKMVSKKRPTVEKVKESEESKEEELEDSGVNCSQMELPAEMDVISLRESSIPVGDVANTLQLQEGVKIEVITTKESSSVHLMTNDDKPRIDEQINVEMERERKSTNNQEMEKENEETGSIIIEEADKTQENKANSISVEKLEGIVNEAKVLEMEEESISVDNEAALTETNVSDGIPAEKGEIPSNQNSILERETEKGETEEEPEPEPKQNQEEVRSLIRMQIEQLRNKKRADMISSPIDRNIINRTIPESKKKKRKISFGDEEVAAKKMLPDSDETGWEKKLRIVEVVGGYNPPEKEIVDQQETERVQIINEVLEGEPIKLTKTTNYFEIKGWKRKKFAVPVVANENAKTKFFFDEAVPSCSYATSESSESVSETKGKESTKAAFESNLLEKFLTENSTLNISYKVPKLDAEESITQNYEDILSQNVTLNFPVAEQNDSSSTKSESIEENSQVKKPRVAYKPRTLAEKRKMMEDLEKKQRKVAKLEENYKNSRANKYKSRIYCKGKILKVATRESHIGYLYYITKKGASRRKAKPRKPENLPPKGDESKKAEKPSLLTCLRPSQDTVYYKPGPMSMKTKLQIHASNSEWRTVIKKLPKISLEVTPEYCKSVDPRVAHLIKYEDAVLTEERLDFALSAVKCKKASSLKTFSFPVPYRNGEQFMLMREKVSKPIHETCLEVAKEDDETAVKTVIEKLLNYVDVSLIADTLINEDTEQRDTTEPDIVKPLTPICKKIDTIIKSSRKRKTSLELKRLNVKIIDVDVAEREDDNGSCSKPFCRLGCLCKSLECNKSYNFHCGKEGCMLQCSCNYDKTKHAEERVVLPAGTDILSVGTVSHLQNQAKRHLAKVEKEFVQTVIQSNDQTIILGSGSRDRQRRATKIPKKMSDYISDEIPCNIDDVIEKNYMDNMKCLVKLDKLDYLKELIPFCMVHNLHDCHCNCEAVYPATDTEVSIASDEEDTKQEKSAVPGRTKVVSASSHRITSKRKSKSVRKIHTKHKNTVPSTCGRTVEIPTEYYRHRNSRVGYLDRLKQNLTIKEKKMVNYLDETIIEIPQEINENMEDVKDPLALTPEEEAQMKQKEEEAETLKMLTIPVEKAIQRRKKKISIGSNNSTDALSMRTLLDYGSPKEDMISPTRILAKEFVQLLGNGSASNTQFHLLPWDVLAKRFKNKSLRVWYLTKPGVMKIAITRGICPGVGYKDINLIDQQEEELNIDIVQWLITDEVPKNKNAKEIMVVCKQRSNYLEVCGICEKNSSSQENVSLSLIDSSVNVAAKQERNYLSKRAETFIHKTIDQKIKLLPLIKESFNNQVLICDQETKKQHEAMTVSLPPITSDERWCMVDWNSVFSYLSFPSINYTIALSDIRDLVNVARKSQQTIVLDSKIFNKDNYEKFKHNIYIVPTYQDRIFVGPYTKSEEANIETLIFVSHTSCMYRKYKSKFTRNCCWLTQELSTAINQSSPSKPLENTSPEKPAEMEEPVVIDDDGVTSEKPNNSDDDDDVVLVKDKEFLSEPDLNWYFVTNVTGLGYISAYQIANSKIIDVKWPGNTSIQRYSKEEDAVIGLEK